MDVESYLRARALRERTPDRRRRELCFTCLQPLRTCYCAHVRPFDPNLKFVILIHPLEVRRRIATGRMSHLCLQGSHLLMGYDFTYNSTLNDLLADPCHYPVVLYPGRNSVNLTSLTPPQRRNIFPPGREPLILVIDGTWGTAKKMLRRSRNLFSLPRICFSPEKPSHFRVRQQPKPECYSTIEAIHHVIELLGESRGFDLADNHHGNLLHVFDKMVEQQLDFIRESEARGLGSRHRRKQSPTNS